MGHMDWFSTGRRSIGTSHCTYSMAPDPILVGLSSTLNVQARHTYFCAGSKTSFALSGSAESNNTRKAPRARNSGNTTFQLCTMSSCAS